MSGLNTEPRSPKRAPLHEAGAREPAVGAEDGNAAGAASDDSDDEVADFRMLLPHLIADKNQAKGNGLAAGAIPKRGEKDFEPTGFRGQEKKLEESRRAMEMVIGQERRATSKSLSTATWDPQLGRAVVEVSRGTIMSTLGLTRRAPITAQDSSELLPGSNDVIGPDSQVGVWKAGVFYPRYTSRIELLPEETLYLIERGSLDCRISMKLKDSHREVLVPLSLQHAFSLMIGADGCTRERYQTYAYLKRLGYYVQRAEVSDALRASALAARKKERAEADSDHAIPTPGESTAVRGIIADPRRPLRLVTLLDLFLYVPRRLTQMAIQAASAIAALIQRTVSGTMTAASRLTGAGAFPARRSRLPGRGLLGIGNGRWESYDAIFSRLQIVPCGHDGSQPAASQPSTTSHGLFEPYYYAWRPATHFRKTDPPLPEFRIAIVSARETNLPKLHEFASMFAAVPLEAAGDQDDADVEEKQRAEQEKKRNDESYGKGFVQKRRREEAELARLQKSNASSSVTSRLLRRFMTEDHVQLLERLVRHTGYMYMRFAAFFAHLPPGCLLDSRPARRGGPTRRPVRKPNPFPPLKAGRRSVVLAVVDHGTTSMLRFGEAEFSKWKLMG
ncbi:unnamed protein product [Parajaminaea phylloscopi]